MIVHIVAPCHQVVQPCWITSGLLAKQVLTESSTLLLTTEEGTRISPWGSSSAWMDPIILFHLAYNRTWLARDQDGGARLRALLLDQKDATTELLIRRLLVGVGNVRVYLADW